MKKIPTTTTTRHENEEKHTHPKTRPQAASLKPPEYRHLVYVGRCRYNSFRQAIIGFQKIVVL